MTQMTTSAPKLTVEPLYVVLHPWQVDWAAYAGAQRTARNIGKAKDTPDYDNVGSGVLQSDIMANTASCLCELATSIALNQRWNGPYWRHEERKAAGWPPDVGHKIEVRRTRTVGGGIPVKPKDLNRGLKLVQAYVSDEDLHDVLDCENVANFQTVRVELLGAVDADFAWEHGRQTLEEGRYCDPKYFYPVFELATQL